MSTTVLVVVFCIAGFRFLLPIYRRSRRLPTHKQKIKKDFSGPPATDQLSTDCVSRNLSTTISENQILIFIRSVHDNIIIVCFCLFSSGRVLARRQSMRVETSLYRPATAKRVF